MRRLVRTERHRKITALLLIAPLATFLLFTFLLPIAGMLWRSVDDRDVARIMPQTTAAIGSWDGRGLPGEHTFAARLRPTSLPPRRPVHSTWRPSA